VLGDDDRDRFADEPHGAGRQQRLGHRLVHLRHHRLDRLDPVVGEVLAGEYGDHAFGVLGRAGVNAVDLGVRHG
jgi:hypothetical protein